MATKTIIMDVPSDLAAYIAALQSNPDYTLKGEPIYKLTPDILKQFVNASIITENNELKAREEARIQQEIDRCLCNMVPGPARDKISTMMRRMLKNK